MMTCPVLRKTSYDFHAISIGQNQVYATATAVDAGADPISICEEMYHHIAYLVKQKQLHIVQERLFGSTAIQPDILKAREYSLRSYGVYEDSPVTYIEGSPVWGEGFAGVQLYALRHDQAEDNVWTIYDGEIPCGRSWNHNGTTFTLLHDVHGFEDDDFTVNSREAQTQRMFDRAKDLLQRQNIPYRNVARTWIYLSGILEWYDEFNQVRNRKYKEFDLIPTKSNGVETEQIYLPASTGIGGDNIHGAAAVMDIFAIGRDPRSQIRVFHNTGLSQRSPFRYGSAFSRSTVIQERNAKTIHISGTASIGKDGKTLAIGDPAEQIRNTINTIDALTRAEGASVHDICQATVFLKRGDDFPIYQRLMKNFGLENIPAVCVVADICREDLLFEIDGIAVKGTCRDNFKIGRNN